MHLVVHEEYTVFVREGGRLPEAMTDVVDGEMRSSIGLMYSPSESAVKRRMKCPCLHVYVYENMKKSRLLKLRPVQSIGGVFSLVLIGSVSAEPVTESMLLSSN